MNLEHHSKDLRVIEQKLQEFNNVKSSKSELQEVSEALDATKLEIKDKLDELISEF